MKAPNVSKRAFWEFDFDTIKWEEHSRFLIGRLLERGSEEDIANTIKFYGKERIIKEVLAVDMAYQSVILLTISLFDLDSGVYKGEISNWMKPRTQTEYEDLKKAKDLEAKEILKIYESLI